MTRQNDLEEVSQGLMSKDEYIKTSINLSSNSDFNTILSFNMSLNVYSGLPYQYPYLFRFSLGLAGIAHTIFQIIGYYLYFNLIIVMVPLLLNIVNSYQ